MTTTEFSDEFDVLVSIRVPGTEAFDEYAKSVYLTKAQEQIVLASYAEVENTEEQREHLSNLIKKKVTYNPTNNTVEKPTDLLFILKEEAMVNSVNALVVPIKHDHLWRTLRNPFRNPSKYRVIREDSEDKLILHSKGSVTSYTLTYLRKPCPIILVDLTSTDLSIDNIKTKTDCELNPILHKRILEYAVGLALQSRGVGQE
jgi:hypothetical protein